MPHTVARSHHCETPPPMGLLRDPIGGILAPFTALKGMTLAYAIRSRDGVLIETVSETERNAKLRWLTAHARYYLTAETTSEILDAAFHNRAHPEGLTCVRVKIEPVA